MQRASMETMFVIEVQIMEQLLLRRLDGDFLGDLSHRSADS
jgi:hypothetical protein